MRVRMRDTTATADTGPLRIDEVYDLSDELGQHLVNAGLAAKSTARTAQERAEQDEADAAAEAATPVEQQAAQAGDRPADQSASSFPQRQPINAPQEHAAPRARRDAASQ